MRHAMSYIECAENAMNYIEQPGYVTLWERAADVYLYHLILIDSLFAEFSCFTNIWPVVLVFLFYKSIKNVSPLWAKCLIVKELMVYTL